MYRHYLLSLFPVMTAWILLICIPGPVKKKMLQAIPVFYPKPDPNRSLFSEYLIEKDLSKVKRIKIGLDGDPDLICKKTELIRNEARRICYTKDDRTVIEVKLYPENTYEDYIRLLDNCIRDRIRRYCIYKDVFLIRGSADPKQPVQRITLPEIDL